MLSHRIICYLELYNRNMPNYIDKKHKNQSDSSRAQYHPIDDYLMLFCIFRWLISFLYFTQRLYN
jgi:hypothetical protein